MSLCLGLFVARLPTKYITWIRIRGRLCDMLPSRRLDRRPILQHDIMSFIVDGRTLPSEGASWHADPWITVQWSFLRKHDPTFGMQVDFDHFAGLFCRFIAAYQRYFEEQLGTC